MDACCEAKSEEIEKLKADHKKVLKIVLTINVLLFIVEVTAGFVAHSTALLADSLDMFGDALVYGFSLYVLWRTTESKAMAAMLKGAIMAVFGIAVLGEAIYKMVAGIVPAAETMGIIGALVLLGNGLCFLLLFRHRSDDLNMRSTWLCSRRFLFQGGLARRCSGRSHRRTVFPDRARGLKRVGPRVSRAPA